MRNRQGQKSATELRKSFERRLDLLASAIQQFRIDTQRFLAGDLKIPPDEERQQIERMLRQLRGSTLKGVAENFRLNSLEAQFSSHCDLFGRRLRQQETAASRVAKGESKLDPDRGIVIDQGLDSTSVNALYQGLYLRSGTRNPQIDLERFRSMLGQQAAVIRSKTGCEKISFRVATEDGKLKLKAKPIRG